MRKILNTLFIVCQYLVPQQQLSRLAGKIADCRKPWVKNTFIRWFVQRYGVDMREAAEPEPLNYASFNAFFTRELQAGARPIAGDKNTIVSPADGTISQSGAIYNGRIFQAKGQYYSLTELLGGNEELAEPFRNGRYATIYLSPKDYHRVHMPLAGKLKTQVYVPGELFSVNTLTTDYVPRLFARNERAACIFQTDLGPMAIVLVGAMIVAGIETVWAGQVAPLKREIRTRHYMGRRKPISLKKGQEMGRFKLGSTAIVLFGSEVMDWLDTCQAGAPVRMGEAIGTRLPDTEPA